MRNWLLASILLFPAAASAQLYSSDYYPNPNFHPSPYHLQDLSPGTVQQVGEVVVLQGDDMLVTTDDVTKLFGINANWQAPQITKRVISNFTDEFDEIIVFTMFDDTQASGASAYEISAQNDVSGIGRDVMDQSAQWGSKKKLFAFVNMMKWDQFAAYGTPITDPTSYFYSVLGQEFAHRWLSFMRYKDANGVISSGMLGRDAAHWGSTLQAFASVMDGNEFRDNLDGTYTQIDTNSKYSPLDLYGMGLIPASEVGPFFLIQNAMTASGKSVDPKYPIRRNAQLKGTREDITIDQVIAAEGPRVPSFENSAHGFRVAFVLLTRPGESPASDQVVAAARKLDIVRTVWETRFAAMTGNRGTMCTQVSAPCGAAVARIAGGNVTEAGGNGNMVPEPGEPVTISLDLLNDSPAEAKNIVVRATGTVVTSTEPTTLASLAAAGKVTVPFSGAIPADAPCGVPLLIQADATVDQHVFRGFTQVVPGLSSLITDGFEASPGLFDVNRLKNDVTQANPWQYGSPMAYGGQYGWTFQPTGGHDSDKAWFTGLQPAVSPMRDSGVLGTTTLTSTAIDVSKTYKPVLSYWAWFQSIDFASSQQGGQVGMATMLVDASADGGESWVTIDTVDGAESQWNKREVPLDGVLPLTGTLTLRFTVSNSDATSVVEAGLDDVQLTTLSQTCDPNFVQAPDEMPMVTPKSGCACQVGTAASPPVAALLLLGFGLAIVLLRRRRA
jgi:MYXO-CTERM domain-containing protein